MRGSRVVLELQGFYTPFPNLARCRSKRLPHSSAQYGLPGGHRAAHSTRQLTSLQRGYVIPDAFFGGTPPHPERSRQKRRFLPAEKNPGSARPVPRQSTSSA